MPRSAVTRRRPTHLLAAVAAGAALLGAGAGPAHAVEPNGGDLAFILDQIKRAEAHVAGKPILGGDPDQIAQVQLPYGLRTVKGELNNLVPGQDGFGAADRPFPRLLEPVFRSAGALPFDPDGNGPAALGEATSYAQTSGFVSDAEPRTISNLIVDQSSDNPAAVAASGGATGAAGEDLSIPNTAPDVGLSAPYNSWFTLFGQFFDHGLDLVTKGGSGTVLIPLETDDPLYRADSPQTNFMPLTRAQNQPGADGRVGTADDVRQHTNTTTAFVDQNQTYTSHPSHQVFLREYESAPGGPKATGRLLDAPAPRRGIPTWHDVKQQARDLLGIELTDRDVLNVPLVETDPYGRFVRSADGHAKLVSKDGGAPISGTPGAPASTANAARTNHAFLDDIAHHAAPVNARGQALAPDANTTTGDDRDPATYDNELLGKHFITGDGRGNENIGLTAVHHVFHAEHNLRVDEIKTLVRKQPVDVQAEWHQNEVWNGERLFQAARFVTEMEYQHLVFEEFARKVQPQVNVFGAYDEDIDPAIVSEFANTVYRFGHSMLTDTVARKTADGTDKSVGLIQAFLNPESFHDDGTAAGMTSREAAGSIVRGMTGQVGAEIDEFVTGTLRSNLVGLPLDLAAINIARGRDTGVPPLNEARRQFYNETLHAALKPYESWNDFKLGIRHPESLVNFIAAYGRHPSVLAATKVADRRKAADLLVNGGAGAPADRLAFLDGTGVWANEASGKTTTGVDDIDFWMGGLAEKQMPFGGLLGSTFNFVFETQMEKLQDGDRLYYLTRTAGLNFLSELEQNSFAELIMRTTDTTHLPFDVFSRPDFTFELDRLGTSGAVQDDPGTPYDESRLLTRTPNGTLRFSGAEHAVFGGTPNDDRVHASEGDDTLWGDAGNDNLEGGAGNDSLNGGLGDDVLTDLFGEDNIKGGPGDDAINAGGGLDLILAGAGRDFVVAGSDPKETFAGGDDDFVIAGDAADTVIGGTGNDWLEGGEQSDVMQAEDADPFENGVGGDDVLAGQGGGDDLHSEGGDDVMLTGAGTDFNEGMLGFDWVTHRGDTQPANDDLEFTGLLPPDETRLGDRFTDVEALSGWHQDDVLRGDDRGGLDMFGHELLNLDLVGGTRDLLGGVTSFSSGNILLGGGGSDLLEGRGGNDVIDADSWLDAYISVRSLENPSTEIRRADSMKELQVDVFAGRIKPSQLRVVREIRPAATSDTGVDTVKFADVKANYTITTLTGGRLSIAHTGGDGDDGTDTIVGAERLQFADGITELARNVGNALPAGALTLSTATPKEDQEVSVTRSVSDADGLDESTVRLAWQAETGPNQWTEVGTGERFTPRDAAVGKRLRVVMTYRDGAVPAADETVTSQPTAAVVNVNDVPSGRPTIDITEPKEGDVLTVTRAFADPDGIKEGTLSYAWQVETSPGVWAPAGTGATFTPGDAAVGRRLRVVATWTDEGVTAERVESLPTAAVLNVNDPPTGTVTLSTAAPQEDQSITASRAFDDPQGVNAGTIQYVWEAEVAPDVWSLVHTGASFTPGDAVVGRRLRVAATFTDNGGTQESIAPVVIAAVTNVNDPATGVPGFTRTNAVVGQPITVLTAPIVDLDGLTGVFRYQWQRGRSGNRWENIAGATGVTYTPTRGDRGRPVRVVVSFTDARGAAESRTSGATSNVAEVQGAVPAPVPTPSAALNVASTAQELAAAAATQPAPRLSATITALAVPSTVVASSDRPITVSGKVPAGTDTVRIRVFRLTKRAGAKTKRTKVATVFRKTRRGKKYTFRLTEPKLRRLTSGRYLIEVRVGTSDRTLGPAVVRTITVRKARRS